MILVFQLRQEDYSTDNVYLLSKRRHFSTLISEHGAFGLESSQKGRILALHEAFRLEDEIGRK